MLAMAFTAAAYPAVKPRVLVLTDISSLAAGVREPTKAKHPPNVKLRVNGDRLDARGANDLDRDQPDSRHTALPGTIQARDTEVN